MLLAALTSLWGASCDGKGVKLLGCAAENLPKLARSDGAPPPEAPPLRTDDDADAAGDVPVAVVTLRLEARDGALRLVDPAGRIVFELERSAAGITSILDVSGGERYRPSAASCEPGRFVALSGSVLHVAARDGEVTIEGEHRGPRYLVETRAAPDLRLDAARPEACAGGTGATPSTNDAR